MLLIVEDSEHDRLVARRAFRHSSVSARLQFCESGDDALDLLFQRGEYAQTDDRPRPRLIVLDLNLPGTSGHEVLATLKADETLRRIPVVVLSTSRDERDIEHSYALGANSYMTKPADPAEFVDALGLLVDYWFGPVQLPRAI